MPAAFHSWLLSPWQALEKPEEEGGSCPAPSGNMREEGCDGESSGKFFLAGFLDFAPADAKSGRVGTDLHCTLLQFCTGEDSLVWNLPGLTRRPVLPPPQITLALKMTLTVKLVTPSTGSQGMGGSGPHLSMQQNSTSQGSFCPIPLPRSPLLPPKSLPPQGYIQKGRKLNLWRFIPHRKEHLHYGRGWGGLGATSLGGGEWTPCDHGVLACPPRTF